MTTLEQAARQALEALQCHADLGIRADKAINDLRQALEQPAEQEPVAYACTSRITGTQTFIPHPKPSHIDSDSWDIKPLYTSPPQRKPLTVEQINSMISAREPEDTHEWYLGFWHQGFEQGIRAAEAAHGIGESK